MTAAEEDDSSDTFSLLFLQPTSFFFLVSCGRSERCLSSSVSLFNFIQSSFFFPFFLTYCTVVLVPEDFEEKSFWLQTANGKTRVSPRKVMC